MYGDMLLVVVTDGSGSHQESAEKLRDLNFRFSLPRLSPAPLNRRPHRPSINNSFVNK